MLELGQNQLEYLEKLGHQLALYFVLPVGSTTTIINYLSHKKYSISTLAVLGLSMIGLANSHMHELPLFGHVEWLHIIQSCSGGHGHGHDHHGHDHHHHDTNSSSSGIVGSAISFMNWHRVVNVSGCAFLLISNYLSQKQGCAHHKHHHDHDGHDGSSSSCSHSHSYSH